MKGISCQSYRRHSYSIVHVEETGKYNLYMACDPNVYDVPTEY